MNSSAKPTSNRALLLHCTPAYCWPITLVVGVVVCFQQEQAQLANTFISECPLPTGFKWAYIASQLMSLVGAPLAWASLKQLSSVRGVFVKAYAYGAAGVSVLFAIDLGLRGGRLWM